MPGWRCTSSQHGGVLFQNKSETNQKADSHLFSKTESRLDQVRARAPAFPTLIISTWCWEDDGAVERAVLTHEAFGESTVATSFGAWCSFVVALPMECLCKVSSFLQEETSQTGKRGRNLSRETSSFKSKRIGRTDHDDLEESRRSFQCCKHLLSQGSCLHGNRKSASLLSCWYCSQVFPCGPDGVKD